MFCLSVLQQLSLLMSHFVGSPGGFLHLPPVVVVVSYKPRLLHGFQRVSLVQVQLNAPPPLSPVRMGDEPSEVDHPGCESPED